MAIKYIKKHKINDETEINRIRREIKIMTKLNHPNIINVREGEVISLGVRGHYDYMYDFTAHTHTHSPLSFCWRIILSPENVI